MKLLPLSLPVCLVAAIALAPRSARAEATCSSSGSASPALPACPAPKLAVGPLLELTRSGATMVVGGASVQIQVGATRFAITMSLPL